MSHDRNFMIRAESFGSLVLPGIPPIRQRNCAVSRFVSSWQTSMPDTTGDVDRAKPTAAFQIKANKATYRPAHSKVHSSCFCFISYQLLHQKICNDLQSKSYICFFKKSASIVLPRSLCLHDTIINIRAKINCICHQTASEINIKFICNSYNLSFNTLRTKKLMRYGKPLQ